MRNHLLENALSLLSGAGLGAAIMYLFDPDQGSGRREDLSDMAGSAISSTGQALHSTAQGAGSSARSFAGRVSEYAHDLAGQVGEHASDLGGRASSLASDAIAAAQRSARNASKSASSYASDAADRARDTRDDLSGRASALWSGAKSSAGVEESHPYATAGGITAGTIGVLAVGAGLMYFMDPERGRSRRAWARDKALSVGRRTGKRARSLGRHLGNQMQGVASEAKSMVPPSWSGSQPAGAGERQNISAPTTLTPEVGRI